MTQASAPHTRPNLDAEGLKVELIGLDRLRKERVLTVEEHKRKRAEVIAAWGKR